MFTSIFPRVTISDEGIQINNARFVLWNEIVAVDFKRFLGFEYIIIKRKKVFKWWVPLYLMTEEIYEQTRIHSPENNPFLIELFKNPKPKNGLLRYAVLTISVLVLIVLSVAMKEVIRGLLRH